jgi:hypothetical protein
MEKTNVTERLNRSNVQGRQRWPRADAALLALPPFALRQPARARLLATARTGRITLDGIG